MNASILNSHLRAVLGPYQTHDEVDLCERIALDLEPDATRVHPLQVLAAAVGASLQPLGGQDGDLSWRIGPHPDGLPLVSIVVSYDNSDHPFEACMPFSPKRLEHVFEKAAEHLEDCVVWEFVSCQLDRHDRVDLFEFLTQDAQEAARCFEDALRITRANHHALLIDAIENDAIDAVMDGLGLGVDLRQVDEDGNTALHVAARLDRGAMVAELIKAGAGIEACNKQGQTPLHVASQAGAANACLALLAYNARSQARDLLGLRPIDYAPQVNHVRSL